MQGGFATAPTTPCKEGFRRHPQRRARVGSPAPTMPAPPKPHPSMQPHTPPEPQPETSYHHHLHQGPPSPFRRRGRREQAYHLLSNLLPPPLASNITVVIAI